MALDPELPVRASNPSIAEGGKPFSQKYNRRRFNITPGQDMIIPFEAMCIWFGHPEAVDHPTDKRRRARTQELNRLRVKYGIYENHEKDNDQFPTVKCYDLTTGDEIITVVRDPYGKHLTPDTQTILEREGMQSQLDALTKQLAVLTAQLQEKDKEAADNAKPEVFTTVEEKVEEVAKESPSTAPSIPTPLTPPGPPVRTGPPQNPTPSASVDMPRGPKVTVPTS